MPRDFDAEFHQAGFLSEAMTDMIPTIRAENSEWFDLSAVANEAIQAITMRAVETNHGHSAERGTIATFLLFRLTSAFQGAVLMMERGMIVEARTLIRSMVEDSICLGALCTNPDTFIPMLKSDGAAAKKAQAKLILTLEHTKASEHRAAIQAIADCADKERQLSWKEVAMLSPLAELYLLYRVLSNDSAHPSPTSLARYMAMNEASDGFVYLAGPASEDELRETFSDLFLALTSGGIAYTEMAIDTEGNAAMADLSECFRAISKRHAVRA